jgi:hypothetical protein
MVLQKNTDLHPIQVLRLYSDPPDVFSIDRILEYKKAGMDGHTYNLYLQYKYTPEKQKVKKESLTDFLKSLRTGGYTTSDPIDYNLLDENKKKLLLDMMATALAPLILKGAIINMITPEIVKQAIFNNSIMAKKLDLYYNDKGIIENRWNLNKNTDSASRTLQELINRNIAEITFDFFIKMIKNDVKQKYSDIENNDDNFKKYFKDLLHLSPSVLNTFNIISKEGELARNMLPIQDKNDFILKYIWGEIIMDITQDPVVFYIESKDTLIYKVRTKPDSDSDDGKKIIQHMKQRTNIFIEYFQPIIISDLPDISTLPDHILSRIDPIFLANKIVDNPSIKDNIIGRIYPLASNLDTTLRSNLDTIINAITKYNIQDKKSSNTMFGMIHRNNEVVNPHLVNPSTMSGAGEKHKSKKARRQRRKRTKRVRY